MVFSKRINFFDEKTAFPRTQPQCTLKFLHRFFPTAKQGFPFSNQLCAKPRFHVGIPVWKRGLVFSNPRMEMGIPHFHMGMCQSPFPYGDPRMETFWRPKFLAIRWRLVHDSMAGQNYSPRFYTGSPHMETSRQTKKFPFGDSPFPNRVCAHLGINRYTKEWRIDKATHQNCQHSHSGQNSPRHHDHKITNRHAPPYAFLMIKFPSDAS